MSNIHTHARAREAAAEWLAKEKPLTDMVLDRANRQRIFDAFAAGADWSADHCATVHREEQDLWKARANAARDSLAGLDLGGMNALRLGQTQIDEGGEMVGVSRQALDGLLDWVDRVTGAAIEAELAAINPAEALRQIAERMVDGETVKGVDHASFDAAAMFMEGGVADGARAEPGPSEVAVQISAPWRQAGVADLAAFRISTPDPRFDPAGPVIINGYLFTPTKED